MPLLNRSGIATGNISPERIFSPPMKEAIPEKNDPEHEKTETEPEGTETEPEGTEPEHTDDDYDSREDFYREIVPREYGLISEILESYVFTDCSSTPGAHPMDLRIKFSDNSKCLVNSGSDFCQIDLDTTKKLNQSTNDHTSDIVGAIYTGPNDEFVFSADVENTIIIRDSNTFTELKRLKNSEDPLERILRISPSTCGRYIAVAGMEDISIYNNNMEVVLQYPNHHSDELIFLEFHGEVTYCCSADSKIIKTVNLEEEIFYPDIVPNHLTETGAHDPLNAVDLSYCGKYMLTMANETDKLWLIAENREIPEFDETNDIICSHFTSNCSQLIIGCSDGKIRVISLDTLYIQDFKFDTLNAQIPTLITVSDDGQNLVCALESGQVVSYDAGCMTGAREAAFLYQRNERLRKIDEAGKTAGGIMEKMKEVVGEGGVKERGHSILGG